MKSAVLMTYAFLGITMLLVLLFTMLWVILKSDKTVITNGSARSQLRDPTDPATREYSYHLGLSIFFATSKNNE